MSETKQFFMRLFLFLFPLGIVFGSLTYVLFVSGELTSIVKQEQSNSPLLLGLAYSNTDTYLKMQSVLERNPEIIALGTSRVMSFRAEFFEDPDLFYNAGGAIEKITHFSHFLQAIPEEGGPEVIILGLDQSFFNQNPSNLLSDDIQQKLSQPPRLGGVWQKGVIGLVRDYMQKKFTLHDIFSPQKGIKKIGLSALVNNNGFLNDGSYHYGKITEDPTSSPDYQFKDTLGRIATGTRRFQYSADVSQESVQELATFLQQAKERNITVIGFLPPYAHVVYETMMSMGEKYAYIRNLNEVLQPVFQKNEFDLYDFSDLAELGASDKETIDGFHGSEKAYLRLFLLMASDNEVLKQHVDVEYLEERLSNSEGDYYVFEI